MEWLIVWGIFAVFVGIAASNRGRDGVGWFFLAIIISPLLAAILLAISGEPAKTRARGYIECPFCAEMIKAKAKICPHCRGDVSPTPLVIEGQPSEPPRRSRWR